MKAKKILWRIAFVVVFASLLFYIASCSAVNELYNGGSLNDFFDAAQADVFGEDEPDFTQITVILPVHAGYSAIVGNTAYASLDSDEQRQAYASIEESIFRVTDVSGGENGAYRMARASLPPLSSADIYMVKEAVLVDHPEAFWITGNYTLSYNLHDGDSLVLYSNYSYSEILTMLRSLEKDMAAVLKEIPSNRSEYERELIVHDCLVRDVDYDVRAAELTEKFTISSTSYGALVNKTALCSGYANATKLLLNRVGVSCTTVKGISKGVGHMWNLVCVDDSWYHLDVTWNDPITLSADGINKYDYFNVTDDLISYDHIISHGFETLDIEKVMAETDTLNFYNFDMPACNTLAANFYIKNCLRLNNLSEESTDVISERMLRMCRSGDTALYLWMPDDVEPEAAVLWLDNTLGKGISFANSTIDEGGRKISKCIRIVRAQDDIGMWANVYCVKLVFEEQ